MTPWRTHSYAPRIPPPTKDELDALIHDAVRGDTAAWQRLQAEIAPTISAIARRHRQLRAKGLATNHDDIAEITTTTLERLANTGFRNLQQYLARPAPAGSSGSAGFDGWLYGTVDFVIREHIRQRYGRAPKLAAGEVPKVRLSKRDLQSHAGRIDDLELARGFLHTLGMTAKLTVGEILAHIERAFSAEEVHAVRLYYLEDQGFEAIANALGLEDGKSAERIIRRLNARLRLLFAEKSE